MEQKQLEEEGDMVLVVPQVEDVAEEYTTILQEVAIFHYLQLH